METIFTNNDTTELYRHFNSDGKLLYVGVSISAVERLRQHRQSAAWFFDIATITIEKCDTREDALARELIAIKGEAPLFNKLGVFKRKVTMYKRSNGILYLQYFYNGRNIQNSTQLKDTKESREYVETKIIPFIKADL